MADFITDSMTHALDAPFEDGTPELGGPVDKVNSSASGMVFTDANRIRNNASSYCNYTYAATPPSAEYYVESIVRCITNTGNLWAGGRGASESFNGYKWQINGSAANKIDLYGDSGALLGSGDVSWSAGTDYEIRLEIRDGSKRVYVDDVLKVDSADNTITGAGLIFVGANGSATNSTGFHMASLHAEAITASPLTGGAVTATATSSSTATISGTAATGGTAPFSYQWQRAPDSSGSPGTWANIGSPQTGVGAGIAPTNYSDTGLTTGSTYHWRYVVTDAASATANATSDSETMPRSARTVYVSAAGSDSNDGLTTGTPWLTIGKVNTGGFVPGDQVYFRGGDTFSGSLLCEPSAQPSASSRIIIGSYGTGRATISAGNSYGVKVKDCGYVTVKNLYVTGTLPNYTGTYPNISGTCTNTAKGLIWVETTTTSTWRAGMRIHNCETYGGLFGITFQSTQNHPTAAHEHFRITNCSAHDCGVSAFTLRAGTNSYDIGDICLGQIYRYGKIDKCVAYNIRGITEYTWEKPEGSADYATGIGFFLYNCHRVILDRSVCYNIGDASNNATSGGPGGALYVESTYSTIRRCESYLVYDPAGADGIALDLDGGCSNCVIEYCYAHDCEGTGILVGQLSGYGTFANNHIRYNVVERCGTKYKAGGFRSFGAPSSTKVYGNTFYHSKVGSGTAKLIDTADSDNLFYNNIFSAGDAATFGEVGSGTTLNGNLYHVRSGSTFSLKVGATTHTSFAALQGAGAETLSGVNTGAAGDPVFLDGGNGTTQLPTNEVGNLTAYDLGSGSAARGAAVDWGQLGIEWPITDWHGNPYISDADETYSGNDVGAVAYGSTVATGTSAQRAFTF